MDKKKIKEFFADKKNRRFAGLSALTFLGLIGALALQAVWLYNVYTLIRNDIQKECTSILDTALYEETNIISSHIPDGYEILGGPQNDSISSGSGISPAGSVRINIDRFNHYSISYFLTGSAFISAYLFLFQYISIAMYIALIMD